MLNVERWNELKNMSEEDRFKLGKSLGLIDSQATLPVFILAAENRRDDPEMARHIDSWIT